MRKQAVLILVLCALLLCPRFAAAEGFEPLPMDNFQPGPMPSEAGYISPTEYEDASISVKIFQDRYADTDYFFAHIKISHPSQLRTAPAGIVASPTATFQYETENKATQIARAANAVIAINGDYYTKADKCAVVLRQNRQYRNFANGYTDLYKQQLISLTEFEKLMGKKRFNELLGSYVAKPPGKLTLVPEDDPREPVDLSNTPDQEFAVLPGEE